MQHYVWWTSGPADVVIVPQRGVLVGDLAVRAASAYVRVDKLIALFAVVVSAILELCVKVPGVGALVAFPRPPT